MLLFEVHALQRLTGKNEGRSETLVPSELEASPKPLYKTMAGPELSWALQ